MRARALSASRNTPAVFLLVSRCFGKSEFKFCFGHLLGVVYDSDTGRFQGHRTSPNSLLLHPPLPSPTVYDACVGGNSYQRGRYRRTTSGEELARLYHIAIPKQTDLPISYNIAPSQKVLTIRFKSEVVVVPFCVLVSRSGHEGYRIAMSFAFRNGSCNR